MRRVLENWAGRALLAAPFLPAALFALLPKWLMLRDQGFLIAARSAGMIVPNDRWQDSISWIDRIAFFRQDLLLNFVALPLLLIGGASLLRPRWRAPFVGVVSALVVLLVYADMLSFANVGRYLTVSLMADAARWGSANPHYVMTYISPSSFAKLLAILLAVAALTVWVHRFDTAPRPRRRSRRPALVLAFVSLPVFTACTGAYSAMPATSLHRPVLQEMAASLTAPGRSDALDHLSDTDLRALYDRETNTRRSAPDPRYFGKARGDDVVVFVFETGPARSLDITGELTQFPNLRRLRAHSLIAAAHHSTYPYTSRAIFSILGGTYPIDALDNYFYSTLPMSLPGWPRALQADGYVTASFAPGRSQFTPDTVMLRSLGVTEEHVSSSEPVRAGGPWDQTLARDRETLQLLLQQLDQWLTHGQRFAAVFMPQVGHGPWHDLAGAGNDYPARGRALMALQDEWLGQIMAVLERHGRLDKTVLLITADHGVRTRSEDPSFVGGMIDDYSFHVPLLLWSPSAFPEPVTLRQVSSHIDVAPTLLDLLGDTSPRERFQGLALWDPGLAARRTYFFGRGYLGADGFHDGGRFFMANYLLHSAYEGDRLHFDGNQLLRSDGAEATMLFAGLERIESIRTSWLHRQLVGGAGLVDEKGTAGTVAARREDH